MVHMGACVALFEDTTPEAEKAYIGLLARASPAQKLDMVSGMYAAVLSLSAAGIRTRRPDADDDEVRYLLASLLHGPILAARVRTAPGGRRC
jgi:hypothetical protein